MRHTEEPLLFPLVFEHRLPSYDLRYRLRTRTKRSWAEMLWHRTSLCDQKWQKGWFPCSAACTYKREEGRTEQHFHGPSLQGYRQLVLAQDCENLAACQCGHKHPNVWVVGGATKQTKGHCVQTTGNALPSYNNTAVFLDFLLSSMPE